MHGKNSTTEAIKQFNNIFKCNVEILNNSGGYIFRRVSALFNIAVSITTTYYNKNKCIYRHTVNNENM